MPQLTGNIVDLIRREIYPGTVTIADGESPASTGSAIPRQTTLGTTEACRSCFRVLSTHTSTSKVRCSPGLIRTHRAGTRHCRHCGRSSRNRERLRDRWNPVHGRTSPAYAAEDPLHRPVVRSGHAVRDVRLQPSTVVRSKSCWSRAFLSALGEMMNYPGVLGGDDQCIRKIEAARRRGIPVDGHAPLLEGADLRRYIGTGISTDHESCSLREAREKIDAGMMIQIRRAAKAGNSTR